jgi:hypothetical protein
MGDHMLDFFRTDAELPLCHFHPQALSIPLSGVVWAWLGCRR